MKHRINHFFNASYCNKIQLSYAVCEHAGATFLFIPFKSKSSSYPQQHTLIKNNVHIDKWCFVQPRTSLGIQADHVVGPVTYDWVKISSQVLDSNGRCLLRNIFLSSDCSCQQWSTDNRVYEFIWITDRPPFEQRILYTIAVTARLQLVQESICVLNQQSGVQSPIDRWNITWKIGLVSLCLQSSNLQKSYFVISL